MSKATWGLPGGEVDYGLTERSEKNYSMGKGEFFISHFPSFFQEGREEHGEEFKKKTRKTGGNEN